MIVNAVVSSGTMTDKCNQAARRYIANEEATMTDEQLDEECYLALLSEVESSLTVDAGYRKFECPQARRRA